MKPFALLILGVVVGWAASGVDWSREAIGQDVAQSDKPVNGILNFPDVSVGTVLVRPASDFSFGYSFCDANIHEGWKELSPACGEVVVPESHSVRLALNRDGARDLSWVDKCQTDLVDAIDVSQSSVTDSDLTHLTEFTNVKSLNLDGSSISNAGVASLRRLAHLQFLALDNTQITDEAMAFIATLPRLETIWLSGTAITDVGLKELATSKSIKGISAGRTRVTDTGVFELSRMPDLRTLNLYANDPEFRGDEIEPVITDAAVEMLRRMMSLEYLDLGGSKITSTGLERLASKLVNLRALGIDNTSVTLTDAKSLGKLPKLERLRLVGVRFNDQSAAMLASLPELRQLTTEMELSDIGVTILSEIPHLESMNLQGHGITDESMPSVAQMKSLRTLYLQHTGVTDFGIDKLSEMPALEHIQLTGGKTTTKCIEALALMPRLKRVGLMNTSARGDGERAWSDLNNLSHLEQELWLCHCPMLTTEDIGKLTHFTNLKQLRIEGRSDVSGGRPLTDDDLKQIAGLKHLEFLQLSSTLITDDGLLPLIAMPELKRLTISCLATERGVKTILQIPSIEYITIAAPDLTQESVDSFIHTSTDLATIRVTPFELSGSQVVASASDRFWRNKSDARAKLDAIEGKAAPALTVTDWFNVEKELSLETLRGKVVLVEFWGTWCGPCIAQLPEIRRLRDVYTDRGLVVIGVHSTQEGHAVSNFLDGKKVTWPVATDDSNLTRDAYHVPHWPTCYLIDRKGVIRLADVFNEDREAAIEELLSEEP